MTFNSKVKSNSNSMSNVIAADRKSVLDGLEYFALVTYVIVWVTFVIILGMGAKQLMDFC